MITEQTTQKIQKAADTELSLFRHAVEKIHDSQGNDTVQLESGYRISRKGQRDKDSNPVFKHAQTLAHDKLTFYTVTAPDGKEFSVAIAEKEFHFGPQIHDHAILLINQQDESDLQEFLKTYHSEAVLVDTETQKKFIEFRDKNFKCLDDNDKKLRFADFTVKRLTEDQAVNHPDGIFVDEASRHLNRDDFYQKKKGAFEVTHKDGSFMVVYYHAKQQDYDNSNTMTGMFDGPPPQTPHSGVLVSPENQKYLKALLNYTS